MEISRLVFEVRIHVFECVDLGFETNDFMGKSTTQFVQLVGYEFSSLSLHIDGFGFHISFLFELDLFFVDLIGFFSHLLYIFHEFVLMFTFFDVVILFG